MAELLTITELADALGIRPSTVRRWVLLRQIAFVKVGRAVRFEPGIVAELIAAGRVPPRKGGPGNGR